MPFKLDIFNKEVLANQADYRTVNLLLSGEVEQPDLSPYATKTSLSGYAPLSALNVYAPLSALNALNNYLPLSGGTLTGDLNFTAGRQIRLFSPDNVGVTLEAANTFGSEYGLKTSQLQLTGGRFDIDGDPTLNRAEFRVSGASTQFNIYNKNLARYYLRINATGGFMEGLNTNASGQNSHAEGESTIASGSDSHAEGNNTTAFGATSHAAGAYSRAQFDRSWIWRGTTGANTQVSTTRTDQFMVSAAGGIALYNRVGIGTDNIDNALTVIGDISATGNIYGVAVNALNNFIYTVSSIPVLANKRYGFNTASGSLTATLPSSPQFGDEIELYDIGGTWNVNSLVVDNNFLSIESYLDKLNCNVRFGYIKLIYTNSFVGWKIVPLSLTLPVIPPPDIFITANTFVSTVPFVLQLSGNDSNNTTVTWHWNLTGGSTPDYTTKNVTQTLTYLTTGILPISLTAYNALGNYDIATVSVTADILSAYAPDVSIVANVTAGQAPLTVNLTGVNNIIGYPSPVDVWAWNLTGGNTADFNTQTVTYTYSADGTYTVNLTASNSAGFDTATRTITVASTSLSSDPFSDYVTLLLYFNT